MLRALILVVGLGCATSATGCASARSKSYEYLQTNKHPRPVRAAATLGEITGFIAGLPFTVLLLPFTVPAVLLSEFEDPYRAVAYPSVALSEVGAAVFGSPIDLLFDENDEAAKVPSQPAADPSAGEPEDRRRRRGREDRAPPRDG